MKKKLIWAILGILLVIVGYIVFLVMRPSVSNPDKQFFYIQEGTNLSELKNQLNDKKLLKSNGFDWACKMLRFKKPKPGRYLFKDGMSAFNLVKMLRSGDQSLVKMTIVKERTKELFSGKMGSGKKFDFQLPEQFRFASGLWSGYQYGDVTDHTRHLFS
jgi:UPF0755 protein